MKSTLKVFTTLKKGGKAVDVADEQKGCWKNRSTVHATFNIRKIAEKSTEYGKPAKELCGLKMCY